MRELFRFSLAFSDNNSSSFNKNLLKLIKIELFENNEIGMSISQIRNKIKSNYDLEFSDSELLTSIKSDKGKTINYIDFENLYSIKPSEIEKMKRKSTDELSKIVSRFKSVFVDYNDADVISIIRRFIYYVFNDDKNTFKLFLEKNDFDSSKKSYNFKSEEREIIDNFLTWNDKEKNNYIYNCISCCYEYCLLSLRKDCSNIGEIFKQKTVFLDSNIIFKYTIFDNEKDSYIKLFINKCKKSKIKLYYTNFTKQELLQTIDYKVNSIKKMLKGNRPISTDAFSKMTGTLSMDFYKKYYEWQRKIENRYDDFEKFKYDLKQEVNKGLSEFNMHSFDNFSLGKYKKAFDELSEELKEYKINNHKDPSIESIRHDVNIYMSMRYINKNNDLSTFKNIDSYFITSDKILVNWQREKNIGEVPIFLFPDTWYSILLKYNGRTDNDFDAFCKFLAIRASVDDVNNYEEYRDKILEIILGLNESDEYKEELIYRIDNSLLNDKMVINNIEEYVNTQYESLIEEKVNNVKETESKIRENLINDFNEKNKHENESYYSAGEEDTYNNIIDIKTKDRLKHNKIIQISLLVLFIIISVAFLLLFLILLTKKVIKIDNDFFTYLQNNSLLLTIISFVSTTISGALKLLFKKIDLFSLNQEIVRKRIENKINRKYRKL